MVLNCFGNSEGDINTKDFFLEGGFWDDSVVEYLSSIPDFSSKEQSSRLYDENSSQSLISNARQYLAPSFPTKFSVNKEVEESLSELRLRTPATSPPPYSPLDLSLEEEGLFLEREMKGKGMISSSFPTPPTLSFSPPHSPTRSSLPSALPSSSLHNTRFFDEWDRNRKENLTGGREKGVYPRYNTVSPQREREMERTRPSTSTSTSDRYPSLSSSQMSSSPFRSLDMSSSPSRSARISAVRVGLKEKAREETSAHPSSKLRDPSPSEYYRATRDLSASFAHSTFGLESSDSFSNTNQYPPISGPGKERDPSRSLQVPSYNSFILTSHSSLQPPPTSQSTSSADPERCLLDEVMGSKNPSASWDHLVSRLREASLKGDGFVSFGELRDAIHSIGIYFSENQVRALAEGFKSDGRVRFDCSEMVEALGYQLFRRLKDKAADEAKKKKDKEAEAKKKDLEETYQLALTDVSASILSAHDKDGEFGDGRNGIERFEEREEALEILVPPFVEEDPSDLGLVSFPTLTKVLKDLGARSLDSCTALTIACKYKVSPTEAKKIDSSSSVEILRHRIVMGVLQAEAQRDDRLDRCLAYLGLKFSEGLSLVVNYKDLLSDLSGVIGNLVANWTFSTAKKKLTEKPFTFSLQSTSSPHMTSFLGTNLSRTSSRTSTFRQSDKKNKASGDIWSSVLPPDPLQNLPWTLKQYDLIELLLSQLETADASARRRTLLALQQQVVDFDRTQPSDLEGWSEGCLDGFSAIQALSTAGFSLSKTDRVLVLRVAESLGGRIPFLDILSVLLRSVRDWHSLPSEKALVIKILQAMGCEMPERRKWLWKLKQQLAIAEKKQERTQVYPLSKSLHSDTSFLASSSFRPGSLSTPSRGVSPSVFLSILRWMGLSLEVEEEVSLLDCLEVHSLLTTQSLLESTVKDRQERERREIESEWSSIREHPSKRAPLVLPSPTVSLVRFDSFLSLCASHCGHWWDTYPDLAQALDSAILRQRDILLHRHKDSEYERGLLLEGSREEGEIRSIGSRSLTNPHQSALEDWIQKEVDKESSPSLSLTTSRMTKTRPPSPSRSLLCLSLSGLLRELLVLFSEEDPVLKAQSSFRGETLRSGLVPAAGFLDDRSFRIACHRSSLLSSIPDSVLAKLSKALMEEEELLDPSVSSLEGDTPTGRRKIPYMRFLHYLRSLVSRACSQPFSHSRPAISPGDRIERGLNVESGGIVDRVVRKCAHSDSHASLLYLRQWQVQTLDLDPLGPSSQSPSSEHLSLSLFLKMLSELGVAEVGRLSRWEDEEELDRIDGLGLGIGSGEIESLRIQIANIQLSMNRLVPSTTQSLDLCAFNQLCMTHRGDWRVRLPALRDKIRAGLRDIGQTTLIVYFLLTPIVLGYRQITQELDLRVGKRLASGPPSVSGSNLDRVGRGFCSVGARFLLSRMRSLLSGSSNEGGHPPQPSQLKSLPFTLPDWGRDYAGRESIGQFLLMNSLSLTPLDLYLLADAYDPHPTASRLPFRFLFDSLSDVPALGIGSQDQEDERVDVMWSDPAHQPEPTCSSYSELFSSFVREPGEENRMSQRGRERSIEAGRVLTHIRELLWTAGCEGWKGREREIAYSKTSQAEENKHGQSDEEGRASQDTRDSRIWIAWGLDVRAVVKGFDYDCSGFVSCEDFLSALRLLGCESLSPDTLSHFPGLILPPKSEGRPHVNGLVPYDSLLNLILSLPPPGRRSLLKQNAPPTSPLPQRIHPQPTFESPRPLSPRSHSPSSVHSNSPSKPPRASTPHSPSRPSTRAVSHSSSHPSSLSPTSSPSVRMLFQTLRRSLLSPYLPRPLASPEERARELREELWERHVQDLWGRLLNLFSRFDPHSNSTLSPRDFIISVSLLIDEGAEAENKSKNQKDLPDGLVLSDSEWREVILHFSTRTREREGGGGGEGGVDYLRFIEELLEPSEMRKFREGILLSGRRDRDRVKGPYSPRHDQKTSTLATSSTPLPLHHHLRSPSQPSTHRHPFNPQSTLPLRPSKHTVPPSNPSKSPLPPPPGKISTQGKSPSKPPPSSLPSSPSPHLLHPPPPPPSFPRSSLWYFVSEGLSSQLSTALRSLQAPSSSSPDHPIHAPEPLSGLSFSPLHLACLYSNLPCLRVLLAQGAAEGRDWVGREGAREGIGKGGLWGRDAQGRTPLHIAAAFASEEVVRELLVASRKCLSDRKAIDPLSLKTLGQDGRGRWREWLSCEDLLGNSALDLSRQNRNASAFQLLSKALDGGEREREGQGQGRRGSHSHTYFQNPSQFSSPQQSSLSGTNLSKSVTFSGETRPMGGKERLFTSRPLSASNTRNRN